MAFLYKKRFEIIDSKIIFYPSWVWTIFAVVYLVILILTLLGLLLSQIQFEFFPEILELSILPIIGITCISILFYKIGKRKITVDLRSNEVIKESIWGKKEIIKLDESKIEFTKMIRIYRSITYVCRLVDTSKLNKRKINLFTCSKIPKHQIEEQKILDILKKHTNKKPSEFDRQKSTRLIRILDLINQKNKAVLVLFSLFIFNFSCKENKDNRSRSLTQNKDSLEIYHLFDEAKALQSSNPDSAYLLTIKAGKLSKKLNFGTGIMDYFNASVYHYCLYKGDEKSGRMMADSAMLYANMEGHERNKMSANFTKGVYFQIQEKQDSAIHYYLKALDYQDLTNDTSKLEGLYNNLAILFNYQGKYQQAIAYQKKSLEWSKLKDDPNTLIRYHNNMYRHYLGAKDAISAEKEWRNGLKISKLQKKFPSENELFKVIGDFYLAKKQPDSAIFYFNQHLDYTRQLYDSVYLSQPYISLAKAYADKGDFTESEKYIQKANHWVSPDELPLFSRKDYFETVYKIEKKKGNDGASLKALESLNDINEIFIDKQRKDELANYDRQVKELEKEKKVVENELKIKNKNTWITILGLSSFFLLAIAVTGIQYWRKKKQAASEKLAKMQLESEWKELKSRMEAQQQERNRISQELHDDLGATLTSISLAASLLQEKQTSPEVDIISRSSSDMTNKMNEIVWSLNADNDNIQSLVAYIRKFCTNFLSEANIKIQFTENIENPQYEIKGLLRRNVFHTVKEAINNIVKHANATEVKIQIDVDREKFSIQIADNGKGIQNPEQQSWNNGLRNMRRNIERIKGTIEWLANNGTQIIIKTPLKWEE